MSRVPNGHRNASATSSTFLSTPSASASARPHSPNATPSASMSRAERFEDEKKRIVDSCFSKLDANGQLAESYITHIRIDEDGAYPSTPPPPSSPEANKKPRLIIIAVRSTGRVRMHKARENTNGSFSIGKTWNLEELSAVESFSNLSVPPSSEREREHRQWAGSTGFTVTVTKPYYWQAGTSKEKDFFIASVIKIYRKYTKGQIPELRGFDDRERAMLLGLQPGQRVPSQPSQPTDHGGRSESRQEEIAPPQPPFARREQSRDDSRYRASPGPPPDINERRDPSGGPRQFASQDQMRTASREPERRPGTSPAPQPVYGRQQQQQQQQQRDLGLQAPPSIPSVTSSRAESPQSLARGEGGVISQQRQQQQQQNPRSQSPPLPAPRNGEPQRTTYEDSPTVPQSQTPSAAAAPTSGAGLFQATRSRWMAQEAAAASTPLPPDTFRARTPTQLAPIQTTSPPAHPSFALERSLSIDRTPITAASEASSAGIDLGDMAAVNALTSFWGPEPQLAGTRDLRDEPASPPTPERSRRRLGAAGLGLEGIESSDSLRPMPLATTARPLIGLGVEGAGEGAVGLGSAYGTPREGVSAVATPRGEDPPRLQEPEKTLAAPASIGQLQVPGAFVSPALGASPEVPKPALAEQKRAGTLNIPGAFTSTPSLAAPAPATPTNLSAPKTLAAPSSSGSLAAFSTPPLAPSPLSTPAQTPADEPTEQESFRPGLGPMIQKKAGPGALAARDKFKKAALAAGAVGAFKPRPGGAAEKILRAKREREMNGGVVGGGEADGITAVVPRPGVGGRTESGREPVAAANAIEPEVAKLETTPVVENGKPLEGIRTLDGASPAPPPATAPHTVQLADSAPVPVDSAVDSPQQHSPDANNNDNDASIPRALAPRPQPQPKLARRGAEQEKYLAALGIPAALLSGSSHSMAFALTLEDFGWKDAALRPRELSELEADLRREQARLESGAWLPSSASSPSLHEHSASGGDGREDKVSQVDTLLDKALSECDDLEGRLTLYQLELSSLNDDISFIEAQSQGLQVQSANQKLLYNELASLVALLSLDGRALEALKYGTLEDSRGIGEVEAAVGKLWTALTAMDPGSAGSRRKSAGRLAAGNTVAGMRALREKRDVYDRQSAAFCQRLVHSLERAFEGSVRGAKGRVVRPGSAGGSSGDRLERAAFAESKGSLWVYSPLMLFTKEMNPAAWSTLMRMYTSRAQGLYSDAFREGVVGWKSRAKKVVGGDDGGEALFTTVEKDDVAGGGGGLAANARKLTVKRSQGLAKTLKSAGGTSGIDKRLAVGGHGRAPGAALMACEAFAEAMDEMAPLVGQEQNFVVEFFHARSGEAGDFLDAVAANPPERRKGAPLSENQHAEPDREMARRVTGSMEEIFGFYATETNSLLEWAVSADPIQGVGVMACLSKHIYWLHDTSQEFLLQLLEGLSSRLQSQWAKFVDEQVRAIEDTKVKVKKRKGVIGFMRTFPHFSAAVEHAFLSVAGPDYDGPADSMYDVRRLVDAAYGRINQAMFDSLKVIAKESPVMVVGVGAMKEDEEQEKQMINYCVLLIENMNHYIEEVDDGGKEGVLAEWRGKAMLERAEALDGYVRRLLLRPLSKLNNFLDSLTTELSTHPTNPTAIANRTGFSRKAARTTFKELDVKELRKGVDALHDRIAKHLGHREDPVQTRELVALVEKECERRYEALIDRAERLIGLVWPAGVEGEKNVEVVFTRAEVQAAFVSAARR